MGVRPYVTIFFGVIIDQHQFLDIVRAHNLVKSINLETEDDIFAEGSIDIPKTDFTLNVSRIGNNEYNYTYFISYCKDELDMNMSSPSSIVTFSKEVVKNFNIFLHENGIDDSPETHVFMYYT